MVMLLSLGVLQRLNGRPVEIFAGCQKLIERLIVKVMMMDPHGDSGGGG